MIDFPTALLIAQTVLSPFQQGFLQQMGKEAAGSLVNRIKKLHEQIHVFIAGTQQDATNSALSIEAENQDPEELAAQILLAAKRDPEAFREILKQYHGIKLDLDATRSTGDISANASGGSVITQNVILGGNVQFGDHHEFHGAGESHSTKPLCSVSAKELLSAAASADGQIAKAMDYDAIMKAGDFIIQYGASAREIAKWDAALKELIALGIVDDLFVSPGELYQVTHLGYEFVDADISDGNSSRPS